MGPSYDFAPDPPSLDPSLFKTQTIFTTVAETKPLTVQRINKCHYQ